MKRYALFTPMLARLLAYLLATLLAACSAATPTPVPPTTAPTSQPDTPPTPTQAGPLSSRKFEVVGDESAIPHGSDDAWDASLTSPSAMIRHDGAWLLFRKGYSAYRDPGVGSVGYSTSADGLAWSPGPDPSISDFDGKFGPPGVIPGSVIAAQDGTLAIYFWVTENEATHIASIWRATAPGPDGPWALSPDHAILEHGAPGSWDEGGLISPSVVQRDEGYIMLFTGNDLKGEFNQIGLATSADGISWEKHDGPVFSADGDGWDGGSVQEARIVDTPGGLVMAYTGWPQGAMDAALGLARSTDGVTWERSASPALTARDTGGGGFFHVPALHYADGTYYLFVEVVGGESSSIWLATLTGDPFAAP